MMNIQKAVIAWAKMCETDLDRVTRKVAHRRKNVRCVTHDFYRAELKVSEFATVL